MVTIRPFRPDDEPACRTCIVELQEAERAIDTRLRRGEDMADEYLCQMHERCAQYDGTIIVAEGDRSVLGLALLLACVPFESLDEPLGTYALVAELIVLERARRRGIGRALLAAAEEVAVSKRATELRIAVLSGNTSARRLYRNYGFLPYIETLAKPLNTSNQPNRSQPEAPHD
jgi:ribosomal protein S18 acetylase RimI-like enzyme